MEEAEESLEEAEESLEEAEDPEDTKEESWVWVDIEGTKLGLPLVDVTEEAVLQAAQTLYHKLTSLSPDSSFEPDVSSGSEGSMHL